MFYMALSLAFMAGGIILLYLLWDAEHVEGRTLNAVTFEAIIASFGWDRPIANWAALTAVLAFEAGLLLVAANTGFLGGPAVLANMAADLDAAAVPQPVEPSRDPERGRRHGRRRDPRAARHAWPSLGAGGPLQHQRVPDLLASLAGLVRYWWRHRGERRWLARLVLSSPGSWSAPAFSPSPWSRSSPRAAG